MRPTGRADVSQTKPRAHAICDRCGARYNHDRLRWQFDWRGPRVQNLRYLVCESCYDKAQQSGQRTIILPADPVPINNARPEMYVSDNNALSVIGQDANQATWQYGTRIGTMVNAAGINAAFDGNPYKPAHLSASISVSRSSYRNYVGINWTGNQNTLAAPSTMLAPVITHTLSSYTISSPIDSAFGSSAYVVQGSPVNSAWGGWTTLASGSIAGTVGEVISGTPTGGRYQFNRVAFLGDGVRAIYVSQVSLSVADGSS